jgi:hypothetical protein
LRSNATCTAYAPDQFRAHVAKCCPDAMEQVPKDAWSDSERAATFIATHEERLTVAAKELAYGGGSGAR